MCLLLLSYNTHPRYELVLAANRDEDYDRPTAALEFWSETPDILAGKDLKRSGVWLGVTRTGRIAAITNYREAFLQLDNAPSRGILVSDFLKGVQSPEDYLNQVKIIGHRYNGFNLIVGDESGLFYYSNKGAGIQNIQPGIHGLCNHLLNTPWPKVEKGKSALETLLSGSDSIDIGRIFSILSDESYPPDDKLPDTGVGLEWERVLSPLFINSPSYGTRSSSVVLIDRSGRLTFAERTFDPDKPGSFKIKTRTFSFTISK